MRTRPGVEKSRGVSRVRRRVSMLESSGHGKGVVGPLEKFFLLSSKTEQSNKEGEGGQNGDLFSYDIDAMKRKNAEMYRYFLVVQFLTKVDFVLKRYEYLLLEEEISLLRTLKKMSLESTVLLARLSVRKRSWIRLLKNDYADIPSCFEVVQKLIEINVLEESFCIEDIVPLLESSRLRSLTLESNYLKREELEIKAIQFLKTQRTLSGEYIVFKDVRCIRIRPDVRELLRKVDYLFFMNYKYSFITIHPASYVCPAELKSSEQLDKDVAARSITFDSAECECVEESGFSERSKSDTWSLYISELMNKLDVVKRNVAAIESVEVFRIFKTREEFLRYMRFSDRAVNFAETLGLIGHWGSEWLSSDSINLKALRSREDEIVAIIQESVTDHKKFLHSLDTIFFLVRREQARGEFLLRLGH
ncbi:uncharacterized protein LOC126317006 [Schistocerca gregaria]|uniref:uncharacterized protein LOC126317006 n=1 Tax=Schistocerca gregaria TaxID=7010 RepID=UPI00211F2838|nr:uncharacterized protein LOC126317006 [Schistocerca gregaria]